MIKFAKGVLVLPLFIASSASAQIIEVPDWDNSVRFELVASQDAVRPGDNLELAVVAEIVSGYHLYGPEERKPSRTEVSVVEGPIRPAGQTVFPPVVTRDLLGLGEYDLYEGKIAIRIPVSVEEGAGLRQEVPVDVRVNYQVCTDSACSAPTKQTLSLVLPMVEEGTAVEATHADFFASKD